MVLRLSVGSGMAMVGPGVMAFSPVFLATAGFGAPRLSTSLNVMGAFFGSALPARSRWAWKWPKNAAMPQKSFCVHLSTIGWTWHSAHWSWMPMNRLAVAPTSLAGDGWLLSWLARKNNACGSSSSLP